MESSKVFVDSDVIIDVLAAREPFYQNSSKVLSLAHTNKIQVIVSALTFSNAFYMLRKFSDRHNAIKNLNVLNALATTASVTDQEIKLALSSGFTDFEDAIQYYTALSAGCQFIITRNVGDYKLSDIPVFAPAEFMKLRVWE
jgi:predicted nucleic acid-binding protein